MGLGDRDCSWRRFCGTSYGACWGRSCTCRCSGPASSALMIDCNYIRILRYWPGALRDGKVTPFVISSEIAAESLVCKIQPLEIRQDIRFLEEGPSECVLARILCLPQREIPCNVWQEGRASL